MMPWPGFLWHCRRVNAGIHNGSVLKKVRMAPMPCTIHLFRKEISQLTLTLDLTSRHLVHKGPMGLESAP